MLLSKSVASYNAAHPEVRLANKLFLPDVPAGGSVPGLLAACDPGLLAACDPDLLTTCDPDLLAACDPGLLEVDARRSGDGATKLRLAFDFFSNLTTLNLPLSE